MDEVNAHIVVYNEIRGEIRTKNLTMIIAYKENGILLNETTKGPPTNCINRYTTRYNQFRNVVWFAQVDRTYLEVIR